MTIEQLRLDLKTARHMLDQCERVLASDSGARMAAKRMRTALKASAEAFLWQDGPRP
jgi:hypothetical protein